MHLEVQVALNFLISFLYNKLPRRRVNQFGEELEKAIKLKFQGHWYPDKPVKGSAYRCLKTTPPLDPVFELASQECGVDIQDIQDNLPKELSIWIDPGEVSYRLEEKGAVKILFSEADTPRDHHDREVTRTFNPEAQCFKPIDSVTSQLAGIGISSPEGGSPSSTSSNGSSGGGPFGQCSSPTYKPPSPVVAAPAFMPKSGQPMTFTTATFAQTKFGSTKLKNNNKRSHRMSPTELSHYVKQRAILQQQQQQQHHQQNAVATAAMFAAAAGNGGGQRSRSLSPNPQQSQQLVDPSFLLMASGNAQQQLAAVAAQQQSQQGQQFTTPPNTRGFNSPVMFDNGLSSYLNDLFSNTAVVNSSAAAVSKGLPSPPHQRSASRMSPNSFDKNFLSNNSQAGPNSLIGNGLNLNLALSSPGNASESSNQASANTKGGINFDPMSFNFSNLPYNSQYQHLLVAN